MARYSDMTDEQLYDEILNTYYSQGDIQQLLNNYRISGVTERQITRLTSKAKKDNVGVITSPIIQKETIVIEPDDVFLSIKPSETKDPCLQNIFDKFLLAIYGKKFNDGINGAFGQAQQILSEAKSKHFILKIPQRYDSIFNDLEGRGGGYDYRGLGLTIARFYSSVRHYRDAGKGSVSINYF